MLQKRSLKGKCATLFYLLPILLLAQDLELGLQAHYNFNGSNVKDQTSNGIDGIALDLTAANGIEDTLNSGFQFNGISSSLDLGVDN
ncbi:MAG: hypothetical protein KTR30_13555, partial [Saprospiraceae bacterium]|nr:hypothetical protein [Saprospiraceae bacterium]